VPTPEVLEIILLCAIGLFAGAVGGMLGIGGSVVMIPAMSIVLGPNQHLYQAAAMIVNVFVALPATVQHWRAGVVRWDVSKRMLPIAIVMILIGVAASNLLDGERLRQIFAVFLIYVVGFNIARILQKREEPAIGEQRTGWLATGSIGSIMGFLAGLLGIGGGALAVPLLQRIANLPLRQCIATSSAVMCITAVIGAAARNATIHQHVDEQAVENAGRMLTIGDSLLLAGIIIPTAFLGGVIGAGLTHRLPLNVVRGAFVLLMSWAALRMLGIV
jgi:uncharacterized protein